MKLEGLIGAILSVAGLFADTPAITSVSAQQRYPWNGKVDIAVTFTGSSNEVAQVDCTIAATNSATQAALAVDHVTAVEGAQGEGTTWTRYFIWDAAADVGSVKIDDVALTAASVPNLLGGVQLWVNGPFWAECNVGATKSEESGYYFRWGDTVGYTRNANNDGWVSVKDGTSFSFLGGNCPTYGKSNSALQSAGYIDSTGNLVAAHDAATAHLGAPWRMPTDAEFQALIDKCTTTWTTRNGVSGRLVTGKGAYASKSIFLPVAGFGDGSSLYDLGSYGYYWSSTPTSVSSLDAWILYFRSGDFGRSDRGRFIGRSVRPLRGFAGIGASSLCASIHLALDATSGTRTAAATETIRYSSAWESTDSGATAVVTVNGEAILSSTGAGSVDWMPTRNGTYTLTHRVTRGGEQVGETLTATFVVDLFPENPVITPASGTTFDTSLTVSMSCPTEGATIHYTTDGSEPTLASPVYKSFCVNGKTTVKARAFDADGRGSEVVTAAYALGRCDDPVIVSAGGTTFAHAGNVVRIDYAGTEGVVRYTRDGSEPTGESPRYTGAFTVDDSTVVKAKVFSDRFFDSQTVTANLVRWPIVATPVITAADSFTGSKTKVVITCATDGALVRYTLDGNDPNSHATRYTGPFYVTAGCTVKAYGVLSDYLDSAVAAKSITKTWGIGDTLGKPDHAFTTGGDAGFVRVTDETAPLGESMKSGAIVAKQVSTLETKVTGPGTVSFQWKTSGESNKRLYAEFLVDGEVVTWLDRILGWQTVEAHVDGAGEHTLVWRYVKVEAGGEDCLWVADWAWASDFTATQTTAVPVPYAWLLANSRDVVDEYASYEAVAKQMAANGVNTVEDCYVAGLDPEDAASVFKAQIELVDGQPVVTPSPDLKAARVYTVYGRARLDDAEGWTTPVKPEHRFFRISVKMP